MNDMELSEYLISLFGVGRAECLSDLQLLELLIYTAEYTEDIDVSEYPQILIQAYGSLNAVINAEPEELDTLVHEEVTDLLKTVLLVSEWCCKEYGGQLNLHLKNELCRHLIERLPFSDEETIILAPVDANGNIGIFIHLSNGNSEDVSVETELLMDMVEKDIMKQVIVIHNHPKGSCYPSLDDMDNSGQMFDDFRAMGIYTFEHVIVGEDGVFFVDSGQLFPNDRARVTPKELRRLHKMIGEVFDDSSLFDRHPKIFCYEDGEGEGDDPDGVHEYDEDYYADEYYEYDLADNTEYLENVLSY